MGPPRPPGIHIFREVLPPAISASAARKAALPHRAHAPAAQDLLPDAPEAAKLFLTHMIAHHEGAVMMAKTENTDGKNTDAGGSPLSRPPARRPSWAAGLVSFLSPCVLPGYLWYVSGLTDPTQPRNRRRVLVGVGLFVLGFAVAFTLYGAAFGAIGSWLLRW